MRINLAAHEGVGESQQFIFGNAGAVLRLTPHNAAAVRAVVPATNCSTRRACLYLLNRIFLTPSIVKPNQHYLGQPLLLKQYCSLILSMTGFIH
jgi:hypothetical protein